LNPIELRSDKGALWENFLISERIKLQQYHKLYSNNYFWRTIQKQEIDFIEERDGQIYAFEFKWNKRPKDKIPSSFIREYDAIGHIVDKQNFREFIMPKEQDN
jgi:predicted AAA+ superfamily ATPase